MGSTAWATKTLQGWGRYPRIETECARPEGRAEVLRAFSEREDAPILAYGLGRSYGDAPDRKSTRLNSSHVRISYAVFCLKKKKKLQSDRVTVLKTQSRVIT